MIRNYLKTAFRSLSREKGSTIINIAGLTLGITSSLVLFLIVKHSASFDQYHTKADRIYRVVTKSKGNTGNHFSSGIPAVLPEAFKNDFTEAEEVVFTSYRSGDLIVIPQVSGELKKYEEEIGVVFTEPSFFKIFDRKILIGSADKGLDEPNEAIISKKSALKYFGKEDAVGEILQRNKIDYKVTAIMEDYPVNTDLPFDVMLSYVTIKKEQDQNGWGSTWSDEHCYFLLKENESISKIEAAMPAFVKKHLGEGDANRNERTFLIQPLNEIHTDERFGNYTYNTTPKSMLIALSVIGLFLLVTACINFINLTTAEAIKRSKEVGIRKTLGSSRGQLIFQFVGETFLVTIIAVFISLAGAQLAIGFINPFMETKLALNLGSDFLLWTFLGIVTITVSVLSGLYPSLVVSGFNPVSALKNLSSNKNSSGYGLRKGLVVMQFFISQFFIIGTIIVIQQMDFLQKADLGFDKDAVLTIPIPVEEKPMGVNGSSRMRTLKNEIMQLPGVEKASLSSTPPSSGSSSSTSFTIAGKEDEFGTQVKQTDGDYIGLYNLDLVAGEKIADLDTAVGFVVNEKLVKTAGFASNEEILGKEMAFWGKRYPVKGVVKDFNTVSLSRAIEPVVMLNSISGYETLSIKLNPSDMQATVKLIQAKWETAYPDHIFSYQFLDEQIRGFYDGQRKGAVMLSVFTSLAIFIGCLGLFGLATFMANQKTKEIGVRKVLGASVESIVLLFSKEFVKLIAIGFVFAAPAAWFLMSKYLEQFAYKINIGPMIFITGAGATFLIAILTVGYRSVKAATTNPARSLRSE